MVWLVWRRPPLTTIGREAASRESPVWVERVRSGQPTQGSQMALRNVRARLRMLVGWLRSVDGLTYLALMAVALD